MLGDVGGKIQESGFDTLICPPCPIPWNITELTGIGDNHVQGIDTIHEVGKSLLEHIMEQIQLYEDKHKTTINHYVFVAHNGRRFDIRFLFYKLNELKLSLFGDLVSKSYILDTCSLARKTPKKTIPEDYKLPTLYKYCTGLELSGNHRAIVDALATVEILVYEIFWKIRDKCIYKVDNVGAVVGSAPVIIRPNDDSDTDDKMPIKEVGDTVSVSSGSDNDDDKQLDAVDEEATE
jgi:DNA polymerase III alpha subunit (gram-positive type)